MKLILPASAANTARTYQHAKFLAITRRTFQCLLSVCSKYESTLRMSFKSIFFFLTEKFKCPSKQTFENLNVRFIACQPRTTLHRMFILEISKSCTIFCTSASLVLPGTQFLQSTIAFSETY